MRRGGGKVEVGGRAVLGGQAVAHLLAAEAGALRGGRGAQAHAVVLDGQHQLLAILAGLDAQGAAVDGGEAEAGERRSRDFSWDQINQVVADTYIRLIRQKAALTSR